MLWHRATIQGNRASGYGGGGISNGDGSVTLKGSVIVSGNIASQYGGGFVGSGALGLEGQSAISNNTAQAGGGIYSHGDISMSPASTVTSNSGGGIDHSYGTRTGVDCSPDPNANVFGNTPDDCRLD